jgi:hypothetical protein
MFLMEINQEHLKPYFNQGILIKTDLTGLYSGIDVEDK